jgi:hypothetical protein
LIIFFCFCINIDNFSENKNNILDEYSYYKSDDNEYIYYVNMFYNDPLVIKERPVHFNAGSFFMDRNKNIINESRNIFDIDDFNEIPEVHKLLDNINEEQLNNAIYIGENIIGISKWQILYGHVHDELYLLYDFYNKLSKTNKKINYKILYEFTSDKNIFDYPHENIEIIHNHLFDNIDTINPYTFNYNIIKMTINKRVTIDNTLNKLHEMQLDMIDQAVEYSDLQQAREVIKNIIDKK